MDLFVDIMEKWNRLQTLAYEKDDRLKQNRRKWKQFKRQLEDLEQAANHFNNLDNSCKLISACSDQN